MLTRSLYIVVFIAVLTPACTCHKDVDTVLPTEPQVSQSMSDAQLEQVVATMRVVTLSGDPLAGMIPIATLQPNAFDKPIATGNPTDALGKSSIRFPIDQKIALRAWDPNLLYFPNNFYDVLPQSGVIKETLVVSMVKSASIEAIIIGPDGEPVQNENAGIMLFHPVHGPWWPAEANTDEKGAVSFYQVPPGSYVIRIKVASGPMIELPETYIAPGDSTLLGAVHLH